MSTLDEPRASTPVKWCIDSSSNVTVMLLVSSSTVKQRENVLPAQCELSVLTSPNNDVVLAIRDTSIMGHSVNYKKKRKMSNYLTNNIIKYENSSVIQWTLLQQTTLTPKFECTFAMQAAYLEAFRRTQLWSHRQKSWYRTQPVRISLEVRQHQTMLRLSWRWNLRQIYLLQISTNQHKVIYWIVELLDNQ